MKKFIVAAINSTHFFHIRENKPDVLEGVGGYEYELLTILSRKLKFDYDIVIPDNGRWGEVDGEGNWDSLVGVLQRQKADMVVEVMSLTYEQFAVVDFAFPHRFGHVSFTSRKAGRIQDDFKILYPFQAVVWVGFLLSLFICSLTFALLRYSRQKPLGIAKYCNSVISAAEVLTGNRAFKKVCAKSSTKMFFVFSGLSMRVLTFCFLSVFLSFMVTPLVEPQIKTVQELAKASRRGEAKVTTLVYPILISLLMNEESEVARDLSIHIRKHPNDVIKPGQSSIEKVLNGFVFVSDIQLMKMVAYSTGNDKRLFYSEDNLGMNFMSIAFKKGFCCVKEFDRIIIRLHQAGIYSKLFNDHLRSISSTSTQKDNPEGGSGEGVKSISFSDLRGIFCTVAVCYTVAIVILFLELLWKKINS